MMVSKEKQMTERKLKDWNNMLILLSNTATVTIPLNIKQERIRVGQCFSFLKSCTLQNVII